jgi:hypothetical protein
MIILKFFANSEFHKSLPICGNQPTPSLPAVALEPVSLIGFRQVIATIL